MKWAEQVGDPQRRVELVRGLIKVTSGSSLTILEAALGDANLPSGEVDDLFELIQTRLNETFPSLVIPD